MRKFIQITVTGGEKTDDYLYALADDGTVWRLDAAHVANRRVAWKQLRSAPQDESPSDTPAPTTGA